MRVSSFAVARPAYYDRNATPQTNEYSATVGPHTGTTRYSYTVASGKKAVVEFGFVSLQRVTAPSAGSTYYGAVLSKSFTISLRTPYVESTSVVVLASSVVALPLSLTLYGGESIEASTGDFSTGGTVFYTIQSKLTVYDA